MANRHRISPMYRAEREFADQWRVVSRNGRVIYDSMNGEFPLDGQEAHDLAWAWNSGATSDDEAVQMIEARNRKYPTLATWRWEDELANGA